MILIAAGILSLLLSYFGDKAFKAEDYLLSIYYNLLSTVCALCAAVEIIQGTT